jgi:hypothetical protein
MQIVLMTTTDMMSKRGDDFARMIGSIAASVPDGCRVHHVVLLQRCSDRERDEVFAAIPYSATVLARAERLSLSAARNAMLAVARERNLLHPDALVAFPDDDCWYPETLLRSLVDRFSHDPDLGLLICRVSLTPGSDWTESSMRTATATDVLRRSTSNCMFSRGDVVAQVGDFDPALGLGTPRMAGEDTDFSLRASFVSRKVVFVDQPLVGHREPDLESITKYFGGNMLVASRYALRSPELFFEFGRKLCVGIYLVLRQRLGFGAYLQAVQGSLGAFGRSSG